MGIYGKIYYIIKAYETIPPSLPLYIITRVYHYYRSALTNRYCYYFNYFFFLNKYII